MGESIFTERNINVDAVPVEISFVKVTASRTKMDTILPSIAYFVIFYPVYQVKISLIFV